MKVVIIGGVAGGASAAARLRRLDETAEIIIFEKSGYISYANCGLPYYIGGVIEDRHALTIQTPESFARRFRIDARVHHEVISINNSQKSVTVRNLVTGESFDEPYDKLIIATGAKPFVPDLCRIGSERIFTMRTVEDTYRLDTFIREKEPKTAVIIGGGFIGLEMAENLTHRGIRVTIVERSTQVMQPFDADMAAFIHAKLRQSGVSLKLTRSVTGFRSDSDGIITDIENDSALRSDLVILALGVVPDTSLAGNAGLRLGQRGSIAVDEHMRTSDPDIYAVGDAVEIHHRVTDAQALVPLAGPANKQGRIAADNICGINTAYRGALGSTIIKLFAMTAAITGINEKTAAALGIAYDKIVLSPLSHASYYPDASVMTMKVLWEKNTHRLLGAQIIGFDAVDKRIDVLAAAIYAGLTADELQNLDLAYAPPYASAKDPVNMAGYIIDNILANRIEQFHCEDVERLPRDGRAILLDTRTPREYAMGHADGFINIPVDDLRVRLYELDPKKPVYVMCQSGLRSYIAVCILNHSGFKAYNFSGGYRFYQTVMQDRQFSEKSFPCGMEN